VESEVLIPSEIVDIELMDDRTATEFVEQKKRQFNRGGW
jgi:hypothetical protein